MDLRISSDSYRLELNDKLFITGMFDLIVYEVYNNENSPRKVPNIESYISSEIVLAGTSENYYYLYGDQGKLIKVDPDNDNIDTILDGEYDIYELQVSKDDKITFNALRMKDSAIVLGEIDSSGEVNIINENMQNKVVTLEKLNKRKKYVLKEQNVR